MKGRRPEITDSSRPGYRTNRDVCPTMREERGHSHRPVVWLALLLVDGKDLDVVLGDLIALSLTRVLLSITLLEVRRVVKGGLLVRR